MEKNSFLLTRDSKEGNWFENARWLAEASNLVYKKEEEVKNITEQWGLKNFKFFDNDGTQAFIANNEDVIVIAFRGTEPTEFQDLIADVDARLDKGSYGSQVHKGFQDALNKVWGDMSDYLKACQDKNQALFFTGHSLGGALATLAAAKCSEAKIGPISGLYTYGQPRVGDQNFAEHFKKEFQGKYFRFVNRRDIVTHLPFDSILSIGVVFGGLLPSLLKRKSKTNLPDDKNKKRKKRILLLILVSLAFTFIYVLFKYFHKYAHADDAPILFLDSDKNVYIPTSWWQRFQLHTRIVAEDANRFKLLKNLLSNHGMENYCLMFRQNQKQGNPEKPWKLKKRTFIELFLLFSLIIFFIIFW
ncbi:MAG: lipase family protein [Thiomargarita sp.]|nr:lipase family protein [Thiomargarita sp.]